MRLSEIIAVLEEVAPTARAEEWDNVGLIAGDPAQEVTRALLAIDYTAAVADEARGLGCELVVAYHPPIFAAQKRFVAGGATALVFDAVRRGVALYSPHTALDVADGGTNDVLADLIGLADRAPLRPAPGATVGIGRVGSLPSVPRAGLIARIKEGLGLDRLLVAGPGDGPNDGVVRRAAVCAGAGGDLLGDALRERADLYLTGELRHHDALRAARAGMTVVCTLHSHSERVTLARLAERLAARLPGVALACSRTDRDPFDFA